MSTFISHKLRSCWGRHLQSSLPEGEGRRDFTALTVCHTLSPSCPDLNSLIQGAGNPSTKTDILASFSLENSITKLEGEDKRLFLNFVRKMLQWDPKKRSTALELLDDPWVDRASRGT